MPGSLDQQPEGVAVSELGADPFTRDAPEEDSLGTNPTNEPTRKTGAGSSEAETQHLTQAWRMP
ncbi:hypothetical protein GCM10009858_45740 [Terrabacter carboxydivorans]|uniref:Uncharacterized protein n=1 Tax=Terrabacter carboxydivorans TaxID=619730 RepID=A0ABN3MIE5_9MICO